MSFSFLKQLYIAYFLYLLCYKFFLSYEFILFFSINNIVLKYSSITIYLNIYFLNVILHFIFYLVPFISFKQHVSKITH